MRSAIIVVGLLCVSLIGCDPPSSSRQPKDVHVINMGGIEDGWGVTATPKEHPRIMLNDGDRWVSSDDWSKYGPDKCEQCHTNVLWYKKGEPENGRQRITFSVKTRDYTWQD